MLATIPNGAGSIPPTTGLEAQDCMHYSTSSCPSPRSPLAGSPTTRTAKDRGRDFSDEDESKGDPDMPSLPAGRLIAVDGSLLQQPGVRGIARPPRKL